MEVHPAALRETADAIWDVWTKDTDADLSAQAREARAVLMRLAERIELGDRNWQGGRHA